MTAGEFLMDATRWLLRLGIPAVLLSAMVAGLMAAPPVAGGKGTGLQIGVSGSLFRDKPAQLLQFAVVPFKRYMSTQAGVAGDISFSDDANALTRQLTEKQVQFGVFHGFEFAWARQEHPELKPLVLAVKKPREQRAILVVRQAETAESMADLKGRALAMPKGTREYCRLFVERTCKAGPGGCQWDSHFGKVESPASTADALDGVAQGKFDAAITDTATLESYKQVRPKMWPKLKELQRSDPFPPAVLAYHEGDVDQQTIDNIRRSLMAAHTCADGKSLLAIWDLAKFEAPDNEYDAHLERIAKTYPAPGKE